MGLKDEVRRPSYGTERNFSVDVEHASISDSYTSAGWIGFLLLLVQRNPDN
jgi:hypothetical protein